MTSSFVRKTLAGFIVLLFAGTGMLTPLCAGEPQHETASLQTTEMLDVGFIYNITAALSSIVFTAYGPGEIAKGRQFGSKGEHIAADILLENMTELGLIATKDQLRDLPGEHLTELMNITDYGLTLHHGSESEAVDCYVCYNRFFYPDGSSLAYTGLPVRKTHPSAMEDTTDYVLIQPHGTRLTCSGPLPAFHFHLSLLLDLFTRTIESRRHPHWKGTIVFDASDSSHDMPGPLSPVPVIQINGSVGKRINASVADYTVDFHVTQTKTSVVSYNVIGQLNGTEPGKTVIVDCLYDGWWDQATGDAAIGMGIVLGVAKYFHDHNITPRYTLKFIGFGGEEAGMLGAKYYLATHRREDIVAVIDLNQLGFTQSTPRLTLQIGANSKRFLDDVWAVASRTDYVERTGNVTDIQPMVMPLGHISDDHPFAMMRPSWLPLRGVNTVCFLKYGRWLVHHRDGEGHTAGDVIGQFNWTDVSATGEMILNVTRSLAG